MGSSHRPSHEQVEGPPRAVSGRYLPGLDGVRALAIAGVFAYHLGYGWASGGYLGVDLFFVLSGFLITSLLVEEAMARGAIGLGSFWGRRARRLLPALLVMLTAVVVFVAASSATLPIDWHSLRAGALATVAYVANWQLLFAHQSYFDHFAVQSPLMHTWSLGIEEQFYLLWPLVIVALMRLTKMRAGWRRVGLVLTAGGAAGSAAWMAYLWTHGASVDRVYYGTDTRAFDLLVGACLAMCVAGRPQPSARTQRVLHRAALGAFGVLAICWVTAGLPSGLPRTWMFEGGMLLCAVAAAVVVADVRLLEPGPVGRLLSVPPLRYIGKISYGLYLWHWPVIVELDGARTHTSGLALTAVRVGATLALAIASYHLIESPIRHGWPSMRLSWLRVALVPASMAATALAVVLATVPPQVTAASAAQAVATGHNGRPAAVAGAGHVIGGPISLGRSVSINRPLRVLLLGDSVMLSEFPAIRALFASTHAAVVVNHSQWGFGLTKLKGWQAQVRQWISRAKPDLVVAMWSWDNAALAAHPAAYEPDLEQFARIVLAPAGGVKDLVFQQFPAPGPDTATTTNQPDYPARVAALIDRFDGLAVSMTKLFPGRVVYLPIGPAVLDHGRFATWLPPEANPGARRSTWTRVRQVDNVHFCPAGAARYAAALFADVTATVHLPSPSATWLDGGWVHNYLAYRYPDAGVCPNDHP